MLGSYAVRSRGPGIRRVLVLTALPLLCFAWECGFGYKGVRWGASVEEAKLKVKGDVYLTYNTSWRKGVSLPGFMGRYCSKNCAKDKILKHLYHAGRLSRIAPWEEANEADRNHATHTVEVRKRELGLHSYYYFFDDRLIAVASDPTYAVEACDYKSVLRRLTSKYGRPEIRHQKSWYCPHSVTRWRHRHKYKCWTWEKDSVRIDLLIYFSQFNEGYGWPSTEGDPDDVWVLYSHLPSAQRIEKIHSSFVQYQHQQEKAKELKEEKERKRRRQKALDDL